MAKYSRSPSCKQDELYQLINQPQQVRRFSWRLFEHNQKSKRTEYGRLIKAWKSTPFPLSFPLNHNSFVFLFRGFHSFVEPCCCHRPVSHWFILFCFWGVDEFCTPPRRHYFFMRRTWHARAPVPQHVVGETTKEFCSEKEGKEEMNITNNDNNMTKTPTMVAIFIREDVVKINQLLV